MAKLKENDVINVYNENPMIVTASTQTNPTGYVWELAEDYLKPTVQKLTFSEVEYIYHNGKAIQNGFLTFDDTQRDNVYESLGFKSAEDVLSLSKIQEIIKSPTDKDVKRFINIDNLAAFERVRSALLGLRSTGQYDISTKLVDAINLRYKELSSGQRISNIKIGAEDILVKDPVTENAKLLAEMEELKAMVAALTSQSKVDNVVANTEKKAKKTTTKKEVIPVTEDDK